MDKIKHGGWIGGLLSFLGPQEKVIPETEPSDWDKEH